MSIKLVAVDIDGTLLTQKSEITTEVFEAIQAAKMAGVKIVITTGRPIAGVQNILKDLNLQEDNDFVITFNGALVQNASTGKEMIKTPLSYNDYLDIELLSRKLGVHMHVETKDGIYTANRNIGKYTIHEASLVDMPVYYRTPEEMIDKEIIKIMFIDEPEVLNNAIAKIPVDYSRRFMLVKSKPFFLEVCHKNVSKGNALTSLAEYLNISINETMAIGDEENDRSMLEKAGVAVVMENGTPELKKIADHITKSNDESGVAYAIREWGLN